MSAAPGRSFVKGSFYRPHSRHRPVPQNGSGSNPVFFFGGSDEAHLQTKHMRHGWTESSGLNTAELTAAFFQPWREKNASFCRLILELRFRCIASSGNLSLGRCFDRLFVGPGLVGRVSSPGLAKRAYNMARTAQHHRPASSKGVVVVGWQRGGLDFVWGGPIWQGLRHN